MKYAGLLVGNTELAVDGYRRQPYTPDRAIDFGVAKIPWGCPNLVGFFDSEVGGTMLESCGFQIPHYGVGVGGQLVFPKGSIHGVSA